MHTTIKQVIAFIKLGRFLFLGGGFVMFALGASVAAYQGISINWQTYVFGQLIVTMTQLMVHYSNDYFDLKADELNTTYTPWSGGSRILPDGLLPPRVALIAALILLIGAIILTAIMVLTVSVGPLTGPLFLIGIALSWSYSAPPLRLHSRTLGEITASFVVAVLTPLLGYYLQSGQLDEIMLLATVPLAFFQFNMLTSVHLPDVDSDAAIGKRTVVVHLGPQRTAYLYIGLLFLAYGVIPSLVFWGLPPAVGGAVWLTLPLGIMLGWMIARDKLLLPAWFAFLSITLLMATAIVETITFILIS